MAPGQIATQQLGFCLLQAIPLPYCEFDPATQKADCGPCDIVGFLSDIEGLGNTDHLKLPSKACDIWEDFGPVFFPKGSEVNGDARERTTQARDVGEVPIESPVESRMELLALAEIPESSRYNFLATLQNQQLGLVGQIG